MSEKEKIIYRDPTQPVAARVKDLLARMTLEEKVAQMEPFQVGGMGGLLGDLPREEMPAFMRRMGLVGELPAEGMFPERETMLNADGSFNAEFAAKFFAGAGGGQAVSISGYAPKANAEAANAVQKAAAEHSRLGIPVTFVGEGLHGHVSSGATIFPQALAMASTWNPEQIGRVGRAIGTEARAVGCHEVYAPVMDLGRDPRWGRTEETYGEDPHLAARLAVAMIKGMQGRRLSDADAIAGGGKHFGGHGKPLGGRDSNMEGTTERDLREAHFVPFRAAVEEAGTHSIMAAYHAIDSIPCHANHWLLTEVLRQEWGYRGHVVSDANGIEDLFLKHRVAATPKEAVKLSIEAGVDTHLGFNEYAAYVLELAREGTLPESAIDQAVSWILQIKFELGLFENPYVDPENAARVCNCAAHKELARETARQAIVLLKNEGDLLPLSSRAKSVLVAGPNADRGRNQLGDYSAPGEAVTVLQGVRARFGSGVTVRYAKGCGLKDLDASGIAEAVEAARQSDVAILVLGEASWTEGMTSGEGNDRCTLDLPGVQQQLLEAVYATGTPVVLVLINGRPLTINWAAEHVPAILEAWYPGQEGGHAIADVLWGDYNPGGRLPITIPRTVGQLPRFYNQKPTGRAYDYVDGSFSPLYEFGYGLSYTRFSYRDLAITPAAIRPGGQVAVAVTVENVGARAGDEVVQLYLSDMVGSVVTPLKQLKGFSRITLQPGERRTVEFTLGPKELALLDRHLEPVVEPGTFEVAVGGLKGTFEVK